MNQSNLNFKLYLYFVIFLNILVSVILVRSIYLLTINVMQNQKYNEVKNYLQTLSPLNEEFNSKEENYQKILSSFSEVGNINSFLISLNDATIQSGSRVIETKILESNDDFFISDVSIVGKIDQISSFVQRIEEDIKIKEIQSLNLNTDKDNVSARITIKSYRIKND